MSDFIKVPLLNADSGADGGAAVDGGTTEPAKDANDGGNIGNNGSKENVTDESVKPFAVFPDEASFMGRVSREAKKQVTELIKSLGLEKEDELKTIVNGYREGLEKDKTELQKAQELAAKASKERDELISSLNHKAKVSELKLQALSMGIKPDRVDYVLKLVDADGLEVKDGQVDAKAVESALNKVIKDFPELKGVVGSSKAGQDFSQGNPVDLLTLDMVKAMSPEQVEKRLPEIMQLLAKK
jgi:hypothetical protein